MDQTRVLILGAGYSGRVIGRRLAEQGALVAGTSRTADKAAALAEAGISPFIYAAGDMTPDLLETVREASHLIVSVQPDEAGDPVLRDLRAAGVKALPRLSGIIYLSTVGVYGDHGGAWVDEEAECRPVSRRSAQRLRAEAEWQAFADNVGAGLVVFRLAGIYGPGRNAFVNLRNGTAKRIIRPGQIFNRIHVDDIAGAVEHFIRTGATGIFNGADDEPSPPQDVVEYAAMLMGVEPPPAVDFDEAELSPMARSFYAECKRVSNRKLRQRGYELVHPDFRNALTILWETGSWKGLTQPLP